MNRTLPILGAVTAPGDAPMAEANRSLQQRFEQAMRLEPDLKERGHNPQHQSNAQIRPSQRRTDADSLPQQNNRRNPSEKNQQIPRRSSASTKPSDHQENTAKQQQCSEQSDPRQVAFRSSHEQQDPGFADNPEQVAALDISAKKRRDETAFTAHAGNDLIDASPITVTTNTASEPPTVAPANVTTAVFEHAPPTLSITTSPTEQGLSAIATPHGHVVQVTPTENEWLDKQYQVNDAYEATCVNSIYAIANTMQHRLPPAQESEGITPKLTPALPTGNGELVTQLDAELQTLMALKPVTTGETAPNNELFANPTIWVAPLAMTPGDLQLVRMVPAEINRELSQLLQRLAVDIYQELGRPERAPQLHLTLPALGELSIHIVHHRGELQIDILATSEGQRLLNQGRNDLVDRLQRLYPGERIILDLFTRGDSEQGSRQKRFIHDEWDADA
ncbi:MAG: type III secretion system needle length determinant [Aeromonas sp.]